MRITAWSLHEFSVSVGSAGRLHLNDLLMAATRWRQPPCRPLKILVVQLAHIGDCVLTTGAIASLHRTYPQHEVHVLVSSATAELFEGFEGVRATHTFSPHKYRRERAQRDDRASSLIRALRRERYDVIVNLRSHPMLFLLLRPGVRWVHGLSSALRERRLGRPFLEGDGSRMAVKHVVESFHDALAQVPLPVPVMGPRLALGAHEEEMVTDRLPLMQPGEFAVMHTCSYWRHKGWPTERFAQVAELLWIRYRLPCVLIGSEKDRAHVQALKREICSPAVNMAGEFTLKETACLIRRARLFIGPDGGPMHLASAVGTPTVALFGPADPDLYRPWGCRQIIVHQPLACNPCWQRKCLFPEDGCMNRISVEHVWQGVVRLLEGGSEVFPPVNSGCGAVDAITAGSRTKGAHQ